MGSVIEGGVAVYQAIQQEKRAKELHELDMKIKQRQLQIEEEKLKSAQLNTIASQIEVAQKLDQIAMSSDIKAIDNMPQSFVKERILRAYSIESGHANTLLLRQGLQIDPQSIQLVPGAIDVKA